MSTLTRFGFTWQITQRVAAGAVMLAFFFAAFAAHAERFVVVESSVPAVKVGAELASGGAIAVPEGARVVLVGSSGSILTLHGPFDGVPRSTSTDASDSQLLAAISSLVNTRQVESSTMVAMRAVDVSWRAEFAKTVDDTFAIDATDGGDACLYELSSAQVTRNPAAGAGDVTIHALESNSTAVINWPINAVRMPWPAQMPLLDGHSYLFEEAGQTLTAVATVHLLRSDPTMTGIQRVAQIAKAGCDAQARLLLTIIARTSQ